MEPLTEMMVFAKVVELKSFSAAARVLDTSKSLVSKQVNLLESHLGVRLLNRTTRRMSLTDIGHAYYEHCARILQEVEAARLTASNLQVKPSGILRVSAPAIFAKMHLGDPFQEFLVNFPEVELELDISDRVVDLVDEGFDVAIRITNTPPLGAVARKIADLHFATCATPAYLKRHGTPVMPDDLVAHNCIVYKDLAAHRNNWAYRVKNKNQVISVSGNCRVNSFEVLVQMVLKGAGIARLADYMIGSELMDGSLKEVLSDYAEAKNYAIYLTYMPNRYMQPKLRAFIDHISDYFGPNPQWGVKRHDATAKRSQHKNK